MDQQVHVSYLGLVRNVIGRGEEDIEVLPGASVRQLLRFLIEKHGPPFKESVFEQSGELRPMAQMCVDDRDIKELHGLDARLRSGKEVSILVGVYPPEGG